MINSQDIEKVTSSIVDNFHPRKLILFGSYANGNATESSDLDILVVQDSDLPRYKRALPIKKALRGFGFPVDVVVFTPEEIKSWQNVPNAFITDVINNGRVLYNG